MKFSITIFIFCSLAVSCVLGQNIKQLIELEAVKCIQSTGADPVLLDRFRKGEAIEADDKIKCFGACLMKATGVMSEDGEIDKEFAKAAVPDDLANRDAVLAAIDGCADEKGSSDCETAYAVGVCLHKNHADALSM